MSWEKPETDHKISRRELLKMASTLGTVRLSGVSCTGCGLCGVTCPTGALTSVFEETTSTYRLCFRQGICLACNECVEICPEKCLRLERGAELTPPDNPPLVLFEDAMIYCTECGKPVGTKAMIEGVKTRILARQKLTESQFELCPSCKAKNQFSLLGK